MKGSIQPLNFPGGLFSGGSLPGAVLFLVGKEPGKGEFRQVINLKALNKFLPKERFKMEGLHTACPLYRRGDYMMKLDLKDSYYAVPIHPE